MKSQYGNWDSMGEVADGALWEVASRHHIWATPDRGYECACGAKTITARDSTEHIMNETMKSLTQAGIKLTSRGDT